jgi:hypothetical protein
MKFPHILIAVITLAGLCSADAKAAKTPNSSLLPKSFAGWRVSKPEQISKSAAVADPTNAEVLKEYGFTDFAGATYAREDGRKLTIKAARFQDTSGAYGAFTFFSSPEMLNEKIGDQGYSLNKRILFYRGNVLVDAVFDQLSMMSAAELRELAAELPRTPGTNSNLPTLSRYLPGESYVKNTAKYIMGPLALERENAPLPAQFVDFTKGAEVMLGDYQLSGRQARLMLIDYPTPQLAAEELMQIEAAQQAHRIGDQQISSRRTGPILVIVSGTVSTDDAKLLLASVNYDADVTWNQNTYFNPRNNVASLIVNVILLAGIIIGISIGAGLAFGGFRLVIKRLFPDRVFDRPEQTEIIALHLGDRGNEGRDST